MWWRRLATDIPYLIIFLEQLYSSSITAFPQFLFIKKILYSISLQLLLMLWNVQKPVNSYSSFIIHIFTHQYLFFHLQVTKKNAPCHFTLKPLIINNYPEDMANISALLLTNKSLTVLTNFTITVLNQVIWRSIWMSCVSMNQCGCTVCHTFLEQ